jgi:rhodanese-related sulfurtransferase
MPITSLAPKAAAAAMAAGPHCFVDVRTVEEFNAGRPGGAINVPIAHRSPSGQMAPNADFLAAMKSVAQPGTKVFASCLSGMRSMNACKALEQAGYTSLVNIEGGFGGRPDATGWRDSGLPVDTTPSTYGKPKG